MDIRQKFAQSAAKRYRLHVKKQISRGYRCTPGLLQVLEHFEPRWFSHVRGQTSSTHMWTSLLHILVSTEHCMFDVTVWSKLLTTFNLCLQVQSGLWTPYRCVNQSSRWSSQKLLRFGTRFTASQSGGFDWRWPHWTPLVWIHPAGRVFKALRVFVKEKTCFMEHDPWYYM